MIDEQLYRICNYLNQYLLRNDGYLLRPDPAYLKAGISMLIEKEVLTKEEIKREALEDYSVLIPENLFPGG